MPGIALYNDPVFNNVGYLLITDDEYSVHHDYMITSLASQSQDFTHSVFFKTCMILSLELLIVNQLNRKKERSGLQDKRQFLLLCIQICFDFEKVLNNGGQNYSFVSSL